ncbi:MAG: SlyX family protein [Neisseriaceae bacterium]|nr:SlyX family protein [Neisseriaceae bacterium]MBP6862975.1 SlyX family protein [Neisseriaceae bacterium]
MNNMDTHSVTERLIEAEIKLALQDELLEALNRRMAELQAQLDLQQAQLRLLYQQGMDKGGDGSDEPRSLFDDIPPHY